MMQDRRIFGGWVALVVLVFDQISKHYLVEMMHAHAWQAIEITSFFKLVMVWNTGVSFGLFAGSAEDVQRWVLIAVSLVISSVLGRWLWRHPRPLVALALGMVIGGAVGNVIDRLHWGAVADFFYFHLGEYYWPAFNIADSAIVIGVVLLCWDSIVGENHHPTTGTKA